MCKLLPPKIFKKVRRKIWRSLLASSFEERESLAAEYRKLVIEESLDFGYFGAKKKIT